MLGHARGVGEAEIQCDHRRASASGPGVWPFLSTQPCRAPLEEPVVPTPRAMGQIRPRRCYSMLSMMPDLLGKANQRQTTRRGWRCGGARPGWQQSQAHDLCHTISRVCCTPRLSSSRSERTTGRTWCCNVTRALDASWNALSLGFAGAQFLHSARPVRPLHGWRPPALGHRVREDAGQSVGASRKNTLIVENIVQLQPCCLATSLTMGSPPRRPSQRSITASGSWIIFQHV